MGDLGVDCVRCNTAYNFKSKVNEAGDNDCMYSGIHHSCSYYDLDEFTNNFNRDNNKFSSFSLNVRSLPGKWDEFRNYIGSLSNNNFSRNILGKLVIDSWRFVCYT